MVATQKRRLKSFGLLSSHKLGDLQATLMESVELDKLTLESNFETLNKIIVTKFFKIYLVVVCYLLKILTCQ